MLSLKFSLLLSCVSGQDMGDPAQMAAMMEAMKGKGKGKGGEEDMDPEQMMKMMEMMKAKKGKGKGLDDMMGGMGKGMDGGMGKGMDDMMGGMGKGGMGDMMGGMGKGGMGDMDDVDEMDDMMSGKGKGGKGKGGKPPLSNCNPLTKEQCSEKELGYVEKMDKKSEDEKTKELTRLSKMVESAGKDLTSEQATWMETRALLLGRLLKLTPGADAEADMMGAMDKGKGKGAEGRFTVCNAKTKEHCTDKEKKYLDKMTEKGEEKQKEELTRLRKMKDSLSNVPKEKADWISLRVTLLKKMLESTAPKDAEEDVDDAEPSDEKSDEKETVYE